MQDYYFMFKWRLQIWILEKTSCPANYRAVYSHIKSEGDYNIVNLFSITPRYSAVKSGQFSWAGQYNKCVQWRREGNRTPNVLRTAKQSPLALRLPNCTSGTTPSQTPGIHSKFTHVVRHFNVFIKVQEMSWFAIVKNLLC